MASWAFSRAATNTARTWRCRRASRSSDAPSALDGRAFDRVAWRAAMSTAPEAELSPAALRRIIFASSLGTLFEWYDFYLYGSLAVFFGGLFFPAGNETAQLLQSLATFGAGFAVRPLGAVVFGHIGDLIGRKYTFLITMATMGLATALTGLLPTYDQIGIW